MVEDSGFRRLSFSKWLQFASTWKSILGPGCQFMGIDPPDINPEHHDKDTSIYTGFDVRFQVKKLFSITRDHH